MPSEDALCASQWQWLQGQLLLDAGLEACPHCDALGQGRFCRTCGIQMHEDLTRECPQCKQRDVGPYCPSCGMALVNETLERLDADTFDWDAWARSLAPFLHDLTPAERAMFNGEVNG